MKESQPCRVEPRDSSSASRLSVAVLGAGYVGLVQAAGLSRLGHHVRVGERDRGRVAALRKGRVPIHEPGLEDLVKEGLAAKRLAFHVDNRQAVRGAEVVFIALPTPSGPGGAAETGLIRDALSDLADTLNPGTVLAIKSTVPAGTAVSLSRLPAIRARGIRVVSNPEFLREGKAVEDFLNPDRIVIGSGDPAAIELMTERVYEGLPGERVVVDSVSAEMIKYASNAYLATRISFVNSIANLCEEVGASAPAVLAGMGADHRIGSHYLSPGPGYGGSCLPKDTRALLALAEQHGYAFRLLRSVMETNEEQRIRIIDKVRSAVSGDLSGCVVGIWGVAFKAGTDDIRESPAVAMARLLVDEDATVVVYDPAARIEMAGVRQAEGPLGAVAGADALLVATEWPGFRRVDMGSVRVSMRGRAVVDARNLLDAATVEAAGLVYVSVGNPK